VFEQKASTAATRQRPTSVLGILGSLLTVTLVIAALLTVSLLITAPADVLAKGKPAPGGGSGTVLVTPNPVAVGQVFTISGSGYAANTQINVKDITSTSTSVRILGTTSSGTFSVTSQTWATGSHRIEVWQYSRSKWALAGSGSYSAY